MDEFLLVKFPGSRQLVLNGFTQGLLRVLKREPAIGQGLAGERDRCS